MKLNRSILKLVGGLMVALLPQQGWSEPVSYASHPQALAFIEQVASEDAFDKAYLQQLFAQVHQQESIIKLMDKPAEAKPWKDYRPIFVTDKRASLGKSFFAEHRDTLERAESVYGVPAEIIVAIIGVETYYGSNTGSIRVIDALSTLAFDYPRRSEFFRKELREYLLLTRDEQLNPMSLKGSYAGAMGYGQFMPSSFREYAVDFDGDGRKDIWNNPVDAIGSVANYFKRHGWTKDAPVVTAASNKAAPKDELLNSYWVKGRSDLEPRYTLTQLVEAGLQPVDKLAGEQPATAMKLEGLEGDEYWVGLHNFYVITRYNHSALYAMSVYQLSQKIVN